MIHRKFKAFSANVGTGAALAGVEDDTGGKDVSSSTKTLIYIGIGAVLIFMWVVS